MRPKWLIRALTSKSLDAAESPEFSIVRGLEPAFSNRAFFVYFFPFSLIAALASLVKDASWVWVGVVGALWMVSGALYASALAFRWWVRAKAGQEELRSTKATLRTVSTHLIDRYRKDANFYVLNQWDEVVTVDRQGNAEVRRRVRLFAGQSGAAAIWASRESSSPAPVDRVTVKAVRHWDDGTRADLPVDMVWISDRQHYVCVYPDGGLQPSEVATIDITWSWPQLFEKLVKDGKTEDVFYTFSRACDGFTTQYKFANRQGFAYTFQPTGVASCAVEYPKIRHQSSVKLTVSEVQPDHRITGQLRRVQK